MSLTNDVDNAASDDGPLATNDIGSVTGDEGTEEGTGREDRSDERQVATGEGGSAASCDLGGDVGFALDQSDENLGASDTVDVSGIVTEEDTTERGKGAHQVGLPGDGSLDALNIVGCGETASGRGDLGGGDVVAVLLHRGGCRGCCVECWYRSGVYVC
jgi:hypothetical protein